MDDQGIAIVEVDQQIFRAAADVLHEAASQPRDHVLRERKAQVRAAGLHRLQSASDQRLLQTPANGFNFGQFGHAELLPERAFIDEPRLPHLRPCFSWGI